jgi:tRNA nucleotidyltransferase (CCA-adding enzyme)
MAPPPGQGGEVLERLRELPGGAEVLQLAADRDDVDLVGGAVRDLLLGRTPREIDLVLDGSPASFLDAAVLFARDLAQRLAGEQEPQVSVHERFGTAAVRWSGGRVDIAARRAEDYPQPGALPQVRPGEREQDLRRRDFTVNTIAVGLGGSRRGEISCVGQARADLDAGLLRVLHDRSFQEDPTRLIRLCRYAFRLGFEVEPHTAALAAGALAAGALGTVSAARIGAELRLALGEGDPVGRLRALAELGVLAELQPPMSFDAELLARALELLPMDGRPEALALGCLLMRSAAELGRDGLVVALERLEHPGGEREAVIEAALRAPSLGWEMAAAQAPSQLWDLLAGVAVEAVALAGTCAGQARAAQAAQSWLSELRHTRLQIGGGDLLAAGLSAGPEIGERLGQALRLRLDGKIEAGREAELRAALGR